MELLGSGPDRSNAMGSVLLLLQSHAGIDCVDIYQISILVLCQWTRDRKKMAAKGCRLEDINMA
jgi:hypothetical protein